MRYVANHEDINVLLALSLLRLKRGRLSGQKSIYALIEKAILPSEE